MIAGPEATDSRENALQLGRHVFWVLAIGFALLVLLTLGRLPPVVASHFDGAGVPNGWSSRPMYAGILVTIGVLLPLGIVGLVHGLTRTGSQFLNIPAKEYWSRPEHDQEAVRRVRAYMWWLGGIMTGMAAAIHGLVLKAHTSQPPHLSTPGIILMLGALLAALLLWVVGWYRLLRPPTTGE